MSICIYTLRMWICSGFGVLHERFIQRILVNEIRTPWRKGRAVIFPNNKKRIHSHRVLIFSGDLALQQRNAVREREKKRKLFYLSGCCTVTRLWWHMLGSIGLLHNIAQNTDVGLLLDMPFWSQWELQLACRFIRHSLRWKYTGAGGSETPCSQCVSVSPPPSVRPSTTCCLCPQRRRFSAALAELSI